MRFCNTQNKSESEFTQVLQNGGNFGFTNFVQSGRISFYIKNKQYIDFF